MDIGAPPPFRGVVMEPPDPHDDLRLTLSDDEELSMEMHVPSDIPIPSPSDVPIITTKFTPRIPLNVLNDTDNDLEATDASHIINIPNGSIATTRDGKSDSSHDPVDSSSHIQPIPIESSVDGGESNPYQVEPSAASAGSGDSTSTAICNSGENVVKEDGEEKDLPVDEEEQSEEDSGDVDENNQEERTTSDESHLVVPEVPEGDEEDDFGDFADFAEASAPAPEPSPSNIVDDDDWGDFDTAPRLPTQGRSLSTTSADDVVVDEWDAFGQAATSTNEVNEVDDWSADFVSAPVPVATTTRPSFDTEPVEVLPELESLLDDDTLWGCPSVEEDCSEVASESDGARVQCLVESLDDSQAASSSAITKENDVIFDARLVWLSLRIVEESSALQYQWKNSRHRDQLLKRLHIDPNSSRGALPPLSTSSVLEPTPFSQSASAGSSRRTVLVSSTGKQLAQFSTLQPSVSSSPQSPTSPSSATTPPSTTATKTSSLQPSVAEDSSRVSVVDSLSVPPADFDWENSGLTNPLKGAGRSCALLDMSLLCPSGACAAPTDSLERELDQLGLGASSVKMSAGSEKAGMQNGLGQPSMLDKLMSSASSAKKKYTPSDELSLDARALHDKLPDIEYLKANMIMFPMGR